MTTGEVLFSVTLYRDRTIAIGGHGRYSAIPDILRMVAEAIESGATVLTEDGQLGWDDPGDAAGRCPSRGSS